MPISIIIRCDERRNEVAKRPMQCVSFNYVASSLTCATQVSRESKEKSIAHHNSENILIRSFPSQTSSRENLTFCVVFSSLLV